MGELLRQLPRIELTSFATREVVEFGFGKGVADVVGSRVGDGELGDAEVGLEEFSTVMIVEGSDFASWDIVGMEGGVEEEALSAVGGLELQGGGFGW